MLDYRDIEPMMRGQWGEFLRSEVGVDVPERDKKNMPCPVCGGDDRAHFRESEGRLFLFCRAACGDGGKESTSPEELSMKLSGYDFPELVERCADFVGYVDHNPTPKRPQQTHAPIYEPHRPPQFYAEQGARNTPLHALNEVLAATEIKPWHNIPICAKNSATGFTGDFLALGESLAVPVYFYVNKDSKPRLTGVIEIDGKGRLKTHGFSRGSFAVVGSPTESKVFCTDYISALIINKMLGYQCFYAPTPNAFKKANELFSITHAFVNCDISDVELVDRATLVYYDRVTYLFPVDSLGQTRKLITKTYGELMEMVAADEGSFYEYI